MRIDGKQIAEKILTELRAKIIQLKSKGITPHLVVILLGDNPASKSYVSQKRKKGGEVGIRVNIEHITTKTSQKELLSLIAKLNIDQNVHGIIVQRPLPEHIVENAIAKAINLKKDVDGLHPSSKFEIPLALAVLRILEEIYASTSKVEGRKYKKFIEWLKSKNVVVVGKGKTGGGPVIALLKKIRVKPLIIDSKTQNLQRILKSSDIIISAIGKQGIIHSKNLRHGASLISVGLHKGGDGKLHGDYEEDEIKNIASFYTPTPGGVGPVNVAMLLKNVVHAAEKI